MSLKNRILSTVDKKMVPVEIPEWGFTVYVRTLSGREMTAYREVVEACRDKNETDAVVKLVILTACEENGDRIFTDADADDLKEKNLIALNRLTAEAMKINGFDGTAVEDAKKN